jgi:hypothetical protein
VSIRTTVLVLERFLLCGFWGFIYKGNVRV